MLCCSVVSGQEKNNRPVITGQVVDSKTGDPLGFAVLSLEPWKIQTISDEDGFFTLNAVFAESAELVVSHLGYFDYQKDLTISESMFVTVKMQESAFNVPEVNVMAKKKLAGDKIEIDQLAIEYLQPTSLLDVLLLLPGSVYSSNSMSSFQPVSMRQAGSDDNSSLGLGIMIDGVAQTSDGMRSQMVGYTSNSNSSMDSEMTSRSGMNQGTDLRYISTDHIESVEVTKGIASARY